MRRVPIHYVGDGVKKRRLKGAASNILYWFEPGVNYMIDERDRDTFLARGDEFCLT
jgi:hypothetical protein